MLFTLPAVGLLGKPKVTKVIDVAEGIAVLGNAERTN
jgi:hypothetical protein